jgi:outer membrane lipoprotein SlyB
MSLYFTLSQVPELAGLTRRQRRLVYQCALQALFAEQPSTVWVGGPWITGGILAGALAGLAVAAAGLSQSKLLIIAAGGLAGALLGTFIGAQLVTARLRPYYRRVLEERKDEIAQIN